MTKNSTTKRIILVNETMPPYVYEAAVLLALPFGCEYRARFNQKWISDRVENLFEEKSKSDEKLGLPAVFCQRNNETAELIPLRNVTITHIQKLNTVYHLTYDVGEYMVQMYEEIKLNNQINNVKYFNSHVKDVFKKNERGSPNTENWTNNAEAKMCPLVFETAYPFGVGGDSSSSDIEKTRLNAWINTVNMLQPIEKLHSMPFIRLTIHKLSMINKKSNIVNMKENRFILTNSKSYRINLYHHFIDLRYGKGHPEVGSTVHSYMDHGPYWLEFISPTNDILVTPNKKNFSGRYDYNRFLLTLNEKGMNSYHILQLFFSMPKNAIKGFSPIIEIPIEFKSAMFWRVTFWILSLIFFAIGNSHEVIKDYSVFPHELVRTVVSRVSLAIFGFQLIDFLKWGVRRIKLWQK